jgi:hypothetical protein
MKHRQHPSADTHEGNQAGGAEMTSKHKAHRRGEDAPFS